MPMTLAHRLRQVRSLQGKTLRHVAYPQRDSLYTDLEQGNLVTLQAQLHPMETDMTREGMSKAYGLRQDLFARWLDEEFTWRVCAASPTTTLSGSYPRLARYLYRPLPEVAHRFLADGGFVLLDTETTGKYPHNAETEICEITILDEDAEPLVDSLVRPSRPIPPEVTRDVHGITDEMVADAPTFPELAPTIAAAIAGKIVVAYNALIDVYLLDKLFIQHQCEMPPFDLWCLMQAYAAHWNAPPSGKHRGPAWQKLSDALEQQEIVCESYESHRSLVDVLATYQLLQHFALQYREE